jgi:DNA primase
VAETDLQELADNVWAYDAANEYLTGRGLDVDTIVEAQLGYVPPQDGGRFAHSIAIPYFDAQGRWRSTRYRHLRPDARHKYDQEKGTKQHLYGVSDAQESIVYITEGEFDRLIMKQLGLAAVGIAGATNFARAWRYLFRDAELVLVVMDADEAGRKAKQRIASWVSTVTDVDTIDLPSGADITDLYLSDRDELESLLGLSD